MRHAASGLGLWQDQRLLAYTIFVRQPGGFVIFDAGSSDVSPMVRRAHIVALVHALSSGQEGAVARAINIPPGDTLGEALDWLGCQVVARQREMVLPLDAPASRPTAHEETIE
jgi:hypothetical protein